MPSGSLFALLGPSGSGKSTLLRIVAGLERADAGSVRLDDEDVTGAAPQDRGIGFVFQHYAAFKHMTVFQNVAFGLKVRKRPKAEISARVHELLELVQLEGMAARYPSQLSGGQRQRMGLARALAVEPKVLLLDEPFGALDARVRKELRLWLRRLHDETHTTTVIVTHDQEEAMEVAETVAVMNHGKIEQIAGPVELYEKPANEFVMGFVGAVNRVGDTWVRPHDLEISLSRTGRPARRWSSGSCTSASRCGPSSSGTTARRSPRSSRVTRRPRSSSTSARSSTSGRHARRPSRPEPGNPVVHQVTRMRAVRTL